MDSAAKTLLKWMIKTSQLISWLTPAEIPARKVKTWVLAKKLQIKKIRDNFFRRKKKKHRGKLLNKIIKQVELRYMFLEEWKGLKIQDQMKQR